MTTNEREIAIREGHKIHAETSYFTPRPQLDFVNARYVFCEGFDRGYIAATTEANKRIAELEVQLQNWKDFSKKVQKIDFNDYLQLQASNNDLREALKTIAIESHEELWQREFAFKALSATPAESLQAHDAETIKRYADDLDNNHWVFIPHDLRKPLKGKHDRICYS